MDVRPAAKSVAADERTMDMVDLRRCIGSARFGIEAHDEPVTDLPSQPSQKDGLGRMCKTHWNQYTAGLAREAKARKAAVTDGDAPAADVSPNEATEAPTEPAPKPARRAKSPNVVPAAQGDAG
jgi:hypothetical protein